MPNRLTSEMSQSGFTAAQNAISTLLDLAQRGEIDPWDVQVIDVIDRYLSRLNLGEVREDDAQPTDLPQSGQAFVWASMLVLLKAQTLQLLEESDSEEAAEELETELATASQHPLPARLEQYIHRRAAAPPPRRRRVTLPELIEQIQQMAVILEQPPSQRRVQRQRVRPQSEAQAARTIAELAHSENLTEMAASLEEFLQGCWTQVKLDNGWLKLEELLRLWTQETACRRSQSQTSRTPISKTDRVGIFWALLLLSAQSKVELCQQEFYQDLKIRFLARSTEKESAWELDQETPF
jgi:segregation and condensation protein A